MKKLVELEFQQGRRKYFMGLFLKMNSIAAGLDKIKQLTKSPLKEAWRMGDNILWQGVYI